MWRRRKAGGWAEVRSRQQAEVLVGEGRLERLLLLPAEWGGTDDPRNVVYVPKGFNAIRDRFINDVIMALVKDGKADSLEAMPDYKGDSVVPGALVFVLTNSSTGGQLLQRLDVW